MDPHHVIVLHGWGQSAQHMQPLADLVADSGFSVHNFDLPGFGSASPPSTIWGSTDYAHHINAYLDANNIPSASLIGHSFGGRISLAFAAHYPHRIKKLVLINASGIAIPRPWKRTLRMIFVKKLATLTKWCDNILRTNLFQSTFIPKFASYDYRNAGHMKNILVKTVNEDLSPLASTITSDTLLIWGQNDTETPPAMGKKLATLIPHSQLITLPQKSHSLPQGGGATLCAQLAIPFLV